MSRYITRYKDAPEVQDAVNYEAHVWDGMWSDPTFLIDTEKNEIIFEDGMEPEDATLDRELAPLVDLLNEQAETISGLVAQMARMSELLNA